MSKCDEGNAACFLVTCLTPFKASSFSPTSHSFPFISLIPSFAVHHHQHDACSFFLLITDPTPISKALKARLYTASSIQVMAASYSSCVESNFAELKQRKKRRKLSHETQNVCTRNDENQGITSRRWRTAAEQQIYSTKLLEALRKSRRNSTSPASAKGSEVRETADRVLAVTAKGTTRWSRAILTTRRRMRVRKVRKVKGTGDGRLRRRENNRLPAAEKKVRVLSRLVPGCRKASFTSLLEEASDYIAALEMQVKAMTALTEILTATGGGNSGGAPTST